MTTTINYRGYVIEVRNCVTCYRWKVVCDGDLYAPMFKDEAATLKQAKEAAKAFIDGELWPDNVRPSAIQAARNVVANIPGSVLFGGWL